MSVGDSDNVYITGYTQSTSAIATPGAYHTTLGGAPDAFLARFNFCNMPVVGTMTGPSSVCIGNSITLSVATSGGAWSSAYPGLAVVGSTGIVTGIAAGVDTISYTVTNLCGSTASTKAITVNPLPDAGTITGADTVCVGGSITLSNTSPGGTWSEVNGNTTITGGIVTGITAGIDTIKYSVSNVCGVAHTAKVLNIVSCPAGVNVEPVAGENICLYPNPARDVITISSSANINYVEVRNVLGQVVISGKYDARVVEIDIAELSNGLYIVRINNENIYRMIRQ